MSLFVCCGPFLSVTLVVYWPTLSESSVSYACNLLADFVREVMCPCLLWSFPVGYACSLLADFVRMFCQLRL